MNEATIQNALHYWRTERGHPFIAPNVTFASGEIDLLSISKSGLVYEHEIKISRSDFRADFRHKTEKHVWLQEAKKYRGESAALRAKFARYSIKRILHCANYFFYVVPKDLIPISEIPDYAGLLYWQSSRFYRFGSIEVVRGAPRLHKEKVTKERMEKLAVSMMYRYWNYRLKNDKN